MKNTYNRQFLRVTEFNGWSRKAFRGVAPKKDNKFRELLLSEMQYKSVAPLGLFQPGEQVASGPSLVSGLRQVNNPLYIVTQDRAMQVMTGTSASPQNIEGAQSYAGVAMPCPLENLGDPSFCQDHNIRYAFVGGSMAKGISSVAMV
jgi:hypothetical protein